MKLSAKAEYACLAMIELARREAVAAPARIREVAGPSRIPERYLVQILLRLKGAGLVRSVRGAAGGYRLARPADQISLAEILEAIDGPPAPPPEPADPSARALADVWREAAAAERRVLRGTTLDRLVQRVAPLEWVI